MASEAACGARPQGTTQPGNRIRSGLVCSAASLGLVPPADIRTTSSSDPAHIAIVMDGGRWAQQRLLPRIAGHRQGSMPLRRCIRGCAERGVQVLTVFAFSSENWNPPPGRGQRADGVLEGAAREVPELLRAGIRLLSWASGGPCPRAVRRPCPRPRPTPPATPAGAERPASTTAAAGTSRRPPPGWPSAARRSPRSAWPRHGAGPCARPDLLIRTGGEQRISNFLLWQAAYSELYFTPTACGPISTTPRWMRRWPPLLDASGVLAAPPSSWRARRSTAGLTRRPSVLRQRVITALVLLAILLPALFARSATPSCAVSVHRRRGLGMGAPEQVPASPGAAAPGHGGAVCRALPGTLGVGAVEHPLGLRLAGPGVGAGRRLDLLAHGVAGSCPRLPRGLRWVMGLVFLCVAWLAMAQARRIGVNFLLSAMVLVWTADVFAICRPGAWAAWLTSGASWRRHQPGQRAGKAYGAACWGAGAGDALALWLDALRRGCASLRPPATRLDRAGGRRAVSVRHAQRGG